MSKTIPYIRLDWDWRDDEKVTLLRERHGHKAELAWVQMTVAMAACKGCVRLDEPKHMAVARRYLRTSEAKVWRYADWFAECGLINADIYASASHVTSARAASEQRAREGRSDHGKRMRALAQGGGKPSNSKAGSKMPGGKAVGMMPLGSLLSQAVPQGQS